MPDNIINKEMFLFTPSALIELWSIDGTSAGLSLTYDFYDGSNFNYKSIVFGGTTYTSFPIKLEQMEKDGKGTLPRPKLTVGNIGGFVSLILLGNSDIIGSTVTRKRVFVRSLDAVNFPNGTNPWGTPDSTEVLTTDTFYVNRKIQETPDYIQFELATPIEIDNVQLPGRQMLANSCGFIYRDSTTCGYSGDPVTDKNCKSFGPGGYNLTISAKGEYNSSSTYNAGDSVYIISTILQTAGQQIFFVCLQNGVTGVDNSPINNTNVWVADACQKTMNACKFRFPTGDLHFGGFPGIARYNYQN